MRCSTPSLRRAGASSTRRTCMPTGCRDRAKLQRKDHRALACGARRPSEMVVAGPRSGTRRLDEPGRRRLDQPSLRTDVGRACPISALPASTSSICIATIPDRPVEDDPRRPGGHAARGPDPVLRGLELVGLAPDGGRSEACRRNGWAGFSANQPEWSLASAIPAAPRAISSAWMRAMIEFHRRTDLASIPYSAQAKGISISSAAGTLDPDTARAYDNPATVALPHGLPRWPAPRRTPRRSLFAGPDPSSVPDHSGRRLPDADAARVELRKPPLGSPGERRRALVGPGIGSSAREVVPSGESVDLGTVDHAPARNRPLPRALAAARSRPPARRARQRLASLAGSRDHGAGAAPRTCRRGIRHRARRRRAPGGSSSGPNPSRAGAKPRVSGSRAPRCEPRPRPPSAPAGAQVDLGLGRSAAWLMKRPPRTVPHVDRQRVARARPRRRSSGKRGVGAALRRSARRARSRNAASPRPPRSPAPPASPGRARARASTASHSSPFSATASPMTRGPRRRPACRRAGRGAPRAGSPPRRGRTPSRRRRARARRGRRARRAPGEEA